MQFTGEVDNSSLVFWLVTYMRFKYMNTVNKF